MPAPLVAVVVGFLTGVGGAAYGPALVGAGKAEVVVAGVYYDVGKACAATDPILDALADASPASSRLRRLVAVADAVCAASQRPDNPLNQVRLIVDAIAAIEAARAQVPTSGLAVAAPPPAAVHVRR